MTVQPLRKATQIRDQGRALRVRIAVLTYRRPGDIAAALPQLRDQALSVIDDRTAVDIVVVDNDPQGCARQTVGSFAAEHARVTVHYENEPAPGISAARNRALATASECDVLVFIDDDERPTPRWLASLLETYRVHGSAAVVGPVISEFEVKPDRWVQAGRFFNRRRLPTGTPVDVAATNNLLLDLHQIRAMGLDFDPRFGISGGGDTMFSRDLHRRGGVLIWNDEAVVMDVVPRERVTRRWVIRRALRSGTSWSTVALALARTRWERLGLRLQLTARGLARLLGGAVRCTAGTLTHSCSHQARGLRTAARGAGMLSGAWGYAYQEYKRSA